MMAARTIIAQYVKEMRKKYKLTQVDLSEKAGVGLRFMWERTTKVKIIIHPSVISCGI